MNTGIIDHPEKGDDTTNLIFSTRENEGPVQVYVAAEQSFHSAPKIQFSPVQGVSSAAFQALLQLPIVM